ncbi:hypothetical protein AAKU55_005331 [Oxalobacteraceae bacterium GrIS 1.11]
MRSNTFTHPRPGIVGRLIGKLLASRRVMAARRAVFSRLPFLVLESDVRDVVYCNWVVKVADVADMVPPGVKLWQRNGETLFTVLTYAHRHFGPALAGPLRRVFPSPLQSNWRLYVEDLPGAQKADGTVLFVNNVLDMAAYAVGSRLFSETLPSHLAAAFTYQKEGGHYRTDIQGGLGSATTFHNEAQESTARRLPAAFQAFFSSWSAAVEYMCLQHAAITWVEDVGRIGHADIKLPIDCGAVLALEAVPGMTASPFLDRIGARGEPFCFVVPAVNFQVVAERLLPQR